MSFDTPLLLFIAPVLGLAFGFGAWLARRQRIRLARRWSISLGRLARSRGGWAPLVLGLCALLAAIGLAGPRAGRTEVTTHTRALSLVFAIDISRSMLAEDVAPSRLQRAGREARRLIQDLEGDRLGLIAFAGRSYILAPLTVDGGAVRMYLDALDPDLASEGGTSLSAVLAQGADLLGAQDRPLPLDAPRVRRASSRAPRRSSGRRACRCTLSPNWPASTSKLSSPARAAMRPWRDTRAMRGR